MYLKKIKGALQTLVGPNGGYFFFRVLPAEERLAAMACFWGYPSFIIFLMFEETVFLEEPFLSGTGHSPFFLVVYFLPRQVNWLAPEDRADLKASLKDFLLKEPWLVLGEGPCLGL